MEWSWAVRELLNFVLEGVKVNPEELATEEGEEEGKGKWGGRGNRITDKQLCRCCSTCAVRSARIYFFYQSNYLYTHLKHVHITY